MSRALLFVSWCLVLAGCPDTGVLCSEGLTR